MEKNVIKDTLIWNILQTIFKTKYKALENHIKYG